jgi:hypothetical protein
MSAAHNRPCAMRRSGLHSYRFRHRWGFVMLGAIDDADAMFQARRSTDAPGTLERWNGREYRPCT